MIHTAGYTVGSNRPLTHARILWAPIAGDVTADGTDGALAANDFTFQRWQAGTADAEWVLETAAAAAVDCLFVAAHNLSGATLTVRTSATTDGAFTDRASFSVPDDETVAVLFNTAGGAPHSIRRLMVRLTNTGGVARNIGIIRAGVALQMQQALYVGHGPLALNRRSVLIDAQSETGQWIGRMLRRRSVAAAYEWQMLRQAWYEQHFEPFAATLPGRPFGIVGNPLRMPRDVGWCWTDTDVAPAITGPRDLMAVSLPVTGFY